jgi:ribosomal protein L20
MAPSQQRAAVVTETGVDLRLVDIPPLGPRQIRIKVTAVAQNPIDCQFITTFRMHQQATHRPFQGCYLDRHLTKPSMVELWVPIIQAWLRNSDRMFQRV